MAEPTGLLVGTPAKHFAPRLVLLSLLGAEFAVAVLAPQMVGVLDQVRIEVLHVEQLIGRGTFENGFDDVVRHAARVFEGCKKPKSCHIIIIEFLLEFAKYAPSMFRCSTRIHISCREVTLWMAPVLTPEYTFVLKKKKLTLN